MASFDIDLFSGALVRKDASVSESINSNARGVFAEYLLDDASGPGVTNYARSPQPATNFWSFVGEKASNIGGSGWTDHYALDPWGSMNASRLVKSAGAWTINPFASLVSGKTYTYGFYAKSTDGTPQTFRQSDNNTPTDDITVGADWTLLPHMFLNSTGGGQNFYVIQASSLGLAVDILVCGFFFYEAPSAPAVIPNSGNLGFYLGREPSWVTGGLSFTADGQVAATAISPVLCAGTNLTVAFKWPSANAPARNIGLFGSDTENIYFKLNGGAATFKFGAVTVGGGNLLQLKDDTIHLLDANYDGTTLDLKLDDVQVGSLTTTQPPQILSNILLGSLAADSGTFPGFIYYAKASSVGAVAPKRRSAPGECLFD